uniref:Cation-transporting P-type ATPase N-terminal domain-containing protein n=1 Tax=Triparma pacifica TaxID=91992 RepID=A0A7S2VWB4_9STRA|mmetsp:Transcript_1680/g.3151  ORF Transcript_1680/g.3151 Transcript_1680/m.3151 type:complete len:1375 (+) Transcript_1680:45-4169(+)|eukprot:CAMPEP_0118639882 /NCGR_PEP_ID=MMETSP0785-20121206/4460_1 /TAXON_ID=91992 /ORGANISM="Bolidomonas pacifica, Strain CCMP 1866" /LENGTH=1374 /DNA_ID=CAMNT_0006531239 /DNA_START=48 /DNA_END=4172 /DNA_ORIENTATION=+
MADAAKKTAEEKAKDLKRNVQLNEHKEDLGDMAKRLGTNYDKGLTSSQVLDLQKKWGPNQLTPPPETHICIKFIKELTDFFSLLLWLGGILCFVGFALDSSQVDYLYLGLVLCFVVLGTGIFSFIQNQKSDNLMKSFANMLPPKVLVLRDGETSYEEGVKLVPGDIVEINAGDLVPADLRILECSDNLVVDNASLTGEAEPQKRKKECTHEDPLETQNLCFFGTQVPEGSCKGVIISTGDHTVMGRIATLAMSTGGEQTPINKELENFIHIISGIAIALGVTFVIINAIRKEELIKNLVFMIGIIVANVPEGLITTVTVCLTLTAQRMSTKMVLVKNLEGVETLGSTSCICSDKTGTLTQNIMTVAQIVYGGKNGFSIEDCESSFSKAGKSYDEDSASFKALCKCATLCNVAVFDEKSKFVTTEDNEFVKDAQGNRIPIDFYNLREQGDGSTIKEVAWKPVGNASEAAMIKFIHPLSDDSNVDVNRALQPAEAVIPFNSKNKYQVHVHVQKEFNAPGTTINTAPEEILKNNKGNRMVYMKGAPERILTRCDKQMVDGKITSMTDADRKKIDDLNMKLAENGLRVLAFCQAELPAKKYPAGTKYTADPDGYCSPNFPIGDFNMTYDSKNKKHPNSDEGMVYLGMMALIDPPRPAVPPAVSKCKTAGIKVIMVTGDHPVTAQAIAYKVGILWSKTVGDMEKENDRAGLSPGQEGWQDPDTAQAIVVPGHTISIDMPEEKWDAILDHPQIVFARTSPQQKLVIVENCQRIGHIVAVTGDGVNDSPALKKADIGVAMGIMGSEVSKNAADMILLDDNFASIVAGVEEGRLIFDNLKKSICYTLTSNIPEISPFISQILFDIPLPLSTVLILGIDLGTDMIPAISMAYETAEADIMKRPPRNSKVDRLVTKKLINLAYLQIGIMQAMSGFYVYMVVLNDYGFPPHTLMGLGGSNYWGKQPLYCRFKGGQYVNVEGEGMSTPVEVFTQTHVDGGVTAKKNLGVLMSGPTKDYPLWDRGDGGYIIDCEFPIMNFKGVAGDAEVDRDSGAQTKTAGESVITYEAIRALEQQGYFHYIPWRGRMSPFWDSDWLSYSIAEKEDSSSITGGAETPGGQMGKSSDSVFFSYGPVGIWSICLADADMSEWTAESFIVAPEGVDQLDAYTPSADPVCSGVANDYVMAGGDGKVKMFSSATFCNGGADQSGDCLDSGVGRFDGDLNMPNWETSCGYSAFKASTDHTYNAGDVGCANIASRMVQKEAQHHAQGAYFISIIVVQWADLLICKTRWLSLRTQGMKNSTMNFGLFFETLLGAWLSYCPAFWAGLGTRPIRFTHWLPGIPWSCLIFTYDEVRKYLMRTTSPEMVDPASGQVIRMKGWLERNTYY